MPTIYPRWIFGFYLRFGNHHPIYAQLLILTDENWILHQFTEKVQCGEQTFLVVIQLPNNAKNISEMDFGDLPHLEKTSDVSLGVAHGRG